MTENKTILRVIKMKWANQPEELELQLKAWEVYPTLKTDCFSKSLEKEYLRAKFVKQLKANRVN